MSDDLDRLEGAAALRSWEEQRAKSFTHWRETVGSVQKALRTACVNGEAGTANLVKFLQHRESAERAYAASLRSDPTPAAEGPSGTGTEAPKSKSASSSRSPSGRQNAEAAVAAPSVPAHPLLGALSELQRTTGDAREALAASIAALTQELGSTDAECRQKNDTLSQGLEDGLSGVVEAHDKVVEAMVVFRRASIQGHQTPSASDDVWLHENAFRMAVKTLRPRQREFTLALCEAVVEVRRLEIDREGVVATVLGRYCETLHKAETNVQSIANDAIRALVGHQRSQAASPAAMTPSLRGLDALLSASPIPPEKLPPAPPPGSSAQQEQWPALRQLRLLGCFEAPPASRLTIMHALVQKRGHWYGQNPCMAVLTKDRWLHCFILEPPKVDPSNSKGNVKEKAVPPPAAPGDVEMELRPHWSMFVPNTTVSLVAGKDRWLEVEETRKGIFGIKNTRREVLQVESKEAVQQWIVALQTQATTPLALPSGETVGAASVRQRSPARAAQSAAGDHPVGAVATTTTAPASGDGVRQDRPETAESVFG